MLLAPFIARIRRRSLLIAVALVGGVLGVLPDLLGLIGIMVFRSESIYESAHKGPIKDILQYIPMYALHLGVDSLTHDPDRQWYGWNVRIWLQILLWIANITVIIWFVRIWQRVHGVERRKDGEVLP